jgi:hypothetical protein
MSRTQFNSILEKKNNRDLEHPDHFPIGLHHCREREDDL